MTKKIAIGADHGGFELKEKLLPWLKEEGYDVSDLGAKTFEKTDDYPDVLLDLYNAMNKGDYDLAIIMCGSGLGISIMANRFPNIRCAMANTELLAEMTRKDNDANVLALGGRMITDYAAKPIIKKFLDTEFEGGRHQRRIDKINDICSKI